MGACVLSGLSGVWRWIKVCCAAQKALHCVRGGTAAAQLSGSPGWQVGCMGTNRVSYFPFTYLTALTAVQKVMRKVVLTIGKMFSYFHTIPFLMNI